MVIGRMYCGSSAVDFVVNETKSESNIYLVIISGAKSIPLSLGDCEINAVKFHGYLPTPLLNFNKLHFRLFTMWNTRTN